MNIVINGINLSEIKAKQDALHAEMAAIRNSIQQGAVAFVAERIEAAKLSVAALKNEAEKEDANVDQIITLAKEATLALTESKFVAEVAAISYDLPFPESSYAYSGYSSDEIITSVVDEIEIQGEYYWRMPKGELKAALEALYAVAEDMEGTVQEWNSSYC